MLSKEEISMFILINNEIEKFVKIQDKVLDIYKKDNELTIKEKQLFQVLHNNLSNLIYLKNEILGLERSDT